MAPLSTFQLPLPSNGPPTGYGWEGHNISVLSTTTAFKIGVGERDIFLGQHRCVVCGESGDIILMHCYVFKDAEPLAETWFDLKTLRGWIPSQAKGHPQHEPRNCLLMCANHCVMFDEHLFFIRFIPNVQKFVLVNYCNAPFLAEFHGKAIALDIKDHHAPFPSLFILHEMHVRGFHPFQPINPEIGDGGWQDWIYSDGVFDELSNSFKQDSPPKDECTHNHSLSTQSQLQFNPSTMDQSGASPGVHRIELNEGVIADILAATHASPSWKACQMEGISWTGTADENIQKYLSSVGVEEPLP